MNMENRFKLADCVGLTALFLTGLLSATLLVLKPLIVGALIDDFRFSATQAGFVAGIELAGVGIAAFVVASLGASWNRRHVILTGATLGILGSVVPVLTEGYVSILTARLIAGTGCGLIASVVLAVIGTTRDPDRTFGRYYLFSFVGGALFMLIGGIVISHFRVTGAYGLLAMMLMLVYITVHHIPGGSSSTKAGKQADQVAAFPLLAAMLILGVSCFFWVGFGAIWAFVERLGLKAGLGQAEIGSVLSASQLAGIAGALTASMLHTRFGRVMHLIASLGIAAVSVVPLGWSTGIASYAIGVLAFSFVWPLFLAFLGGAMSAIDPSGRTVAMSVTSQTFGMAAGSAVGGMLAEVHGYVAIAGMALACFGACFVLLAMLVARTDINVQA
jgi:predicted MFS family arabinose efflux permease